jgi:hypothetical protein
VGVVPALIAALVAAGPRAQLDASVETSAHAGSEYPGPLGADAVRTLDVVPRLDAVVEDPAVRVQATYAPRLLVNQDSGAAGLAAQHNASIAARYRQTRTLEWGASERFRYGRSEFLWDPGLRRPFDSLDGLVPLIPDELFDDTTVGFSWLPARGWNFDASAGYFAYGGISAASQQIVPLQQGPQLFAELSHELTRNDVLSSEVYASYTFATGDRQSSLVKWTASWRRQLAAATSAKLSLGTSFDRRMQTEGAMSLDVYPVAAVELAHDLLARTNRIELRALAGLGPRYSMVTADLQERAEASASARFVLRERFSMRARGAFAHDLLAPLGAANLLVGTLDAGYELRKDLAFAVGAQRTIQQVAPGTQVPGAAWYAFAALTYSARDVL